MTTIFFKPPIPIGVNTAFPAGGEPDSHPLQVNFIHPSSDRFCSLWRTGEGGLASSAVVSGGWLLRTMLRTGRNPVALMRTKMLSMMKRLFKFNFSFQQRMNLPNY